MRDLLALMDVVAFGGVGIIAVARARHREGPAVPAAVAFGALAIAAFAGLFVGDQSPLWYRKALVLGLLVFPFGMYMVAAAFEAPSVKERRMVRAATIAVMATTAVLPVVPIEDQTRPGWWALYVIGVVIYWAWLSMYVSWRLWRCAHHHPALAAKRMQLLAVATSMVTIAIVFSAATEVASSLKLGSGLTGLVAAALFAAALAPPYPLRLVWLQPTITQLRNAIPRLMVVRKWEDAADALLPTAAGILGAKSAAFAEPDGRLVHVWGVPPADAAEHTPAASESAVVIQCRAGQLVVWTSPQLRSFGDNEIAILESLAAIADLAYERCDYTARQDEFIAVAAHELRTPLTVIRGSTTLLQTRGDELGDPDHQQILSALDRHSQRAKQLIDDLLDYASLNAAAMNLRPQPTPVADCLTRSIEAAPPPPGVDVATEFDLGGDLVVADPPRLEQVVVNLLTNAYGHARSTVRVGASVAGESIRIRVCDDGPGVPSTMIDRLFEPFATEGGGTGLGLALSQRLVQAHGGTLSYTPSVGGGACFDVLLPAWSDQHSPHQLGDHGRELTGRHLRPRPINCP